MLPYNESDFIILHPNQSPDEHLLKTCKLLISCDFDRHMMEAIFTEPFQVIPSMKIRMVKSDELDVHIPMEDHILLWVVVSADNPEKIVGWLDQSMAARYYIEQLKQKLELVHLALNSLSIQLRVTLPNNTNPLQLGTSTLNQSDTPTRLSKVFPHLGQEIETQLTLCEETVCRIVEAHEKYKELSIDVNSILQLTDEYIFVSDGNGKALRVSSSCKNLWGYEKENFLGKSVYDLEKEGAFYPSATRLVLEKQEPIKITQKTKTGKKLLVTGTPIKDQSGQIVRVINISKDITEISTLKEQLDREKLRNESYRKKINEILNQDKTSTFIYRSDEMANILMTSYKISEYDSTVLLLGESGVGKEVIANYIHKCSKRAKHPLIKVNCGAIPENLLESELFGYEKGSFTGANKQGKAGLFEAAHQGTIFLDEIGEISFSLQIKLLRVLQEKEVTRIGGIKPIKLDVRVISATNRDLALEVQHNKFREDLYYRLNVVPIYIPPLRERRSDIIPLVMHFTDRFNLKFQKNTHFSSESIDCLFHYHWPGNVRELQNMIERMIVTTDVEYIEPNHLPQIFHRAEEQATKTNMKSPTKFSTEPNPSDERTDKSILIPTALVRNYRRLGISHGELGLICTILSYKQNEHHPNPSEEELAEHLQCSTRQIRKWVQSIREKDFLQVSRIRDHTSRWNTNKYNFDLLLDASNEMITN